jgi:hypothetical protein
VYLGSTATSKPVIKTVSEAKLVNAHQERLRLHQSLMGILDDFDFIRSQLLNCSPLPTIDQAINELIREETRLKSHRFSQPHTVLANPASAAPTATASPRGHDKKRSNQKNYGLISTFCKNQSHTIDQCRMRVRILQRSAALTAYEHAPPLDVASTNSVSLNTPTFSIAELQALFSEVLPSSSSASNFALSVTPSISFEWFIDSACCNQMTVNPHLKASYTPPTLLTITIANGSTITVNHVSSISTPNLFVSNVFYVPKLHFNLLSVGQPTELGFILFFSFSWLSYVVFSDEANSWDHT